MRLIACLSLLPYNFCFVPSSMSLHGGLLHIAVADDGHDHVVQPPLKLCGLSEAFKYINEWDSAWQLCSFLHFCLCIPILLLCSLVLAPARMTSEQSYISR